MLPAKTAKKSDFFQFLTKIFFNLSLSTFNFVSFVKHFVCFVLKKNLKHLNTKTTKNKTQRKHKGLNPILHLKELPQK